VTRNVRPSVVRGLWVIGAVGFALIASGCGSGGASSQGSSSTTTSSAPSNPPAAGPPLFVIASCKVGTFTMPTENEAGRTVSSAGEQVTVTDNWPSQTSVEVENFAVVFYNDGTEVGSILAGPQQGGQNAVTDLFPYPVYLTFGQSQTWTLAAGWTGVATSCRVVQFTSSPTVPLGHFGT
jgi:hypothetical protein